MENVSEYVFEVWNRCLRTNEWFKYYIQNCFSYQTISSEFSYYILINDRLV